MPAVIVTEATEFRKFNPTLGKLDQLIQEITKK